MINEIALIVRLNTEDAPTNDAYTCRLMQEASLLYEVETTWDEINEKHLPATETTELT